MTCMSILLSRDEFREGVFRRDGWKCVICQADAQDAHHIIERRLFHDGGYYLDNGASLCGKCHMEAEQTVLSCEQVRAAAGITRIVLPEHMYRDAVYDKWGNIVQPNGTRIPGELMEDESVRKVLMPLIASGVFVKYFKYPRTYHVPWSEGITDDERTLDDPDQLFGGKEIVVTEKMDGENTTLYGDHLHARSIDSGSHPSRGWVKNLHAQLAHHIPGGWRICGENLFARHTLPYDDLSSFFLVFSIWDDRNFCLSWDATVEYAAILDLATVPVLYRGPYDGKLLRDMHTRLDLTRQEGYVVRVADEFPYRAFRQSVAKFVRRAHVGTAHNWMMQAVVPNKMRKTV